MNLIPDDALLALDKADSPDSASEKRLADSRDVAAIREGHNVEEAFGRLFERHRYSVWCAIWNILKNTHDTEDVHQSVFIQAAQKLHQLHDPHAFGSWLQQIAIRHSINFLRCNAKYSQQAALNDACHTERSAGEASEAQKDELLRNERTQIVRQHVDALPGMYRAVIELYYYEGLSYNEMQQQLKIPLCTIKCRLFRARHLVGALITERHPDYAQDVTD